MKITSSIALSLLASFAAAETFNYWPNTDTTCATKAAGNKIITVADTKAKARSSKDGTPYEASASNIATSAQCSAKKLPFFYVTVLSPVKMTFTYDTATDTYTFCGLETDDVSGDGYPDQCSYTFGL